MGGGGDQLKAGSKTLNVGGEIFLADPKNAQEERWENVASRLGKRGGKGATFHFTDQQEDQEMT